MILLKDKVNVLAPYTGYQYGDSKDNTGSNNGTPLNRATLNDYHMFFARLFGLSGLTSNNLPDNDTNGYQYMDALKCVTRKNLAVAQFSANALMSTLITAYTKFNISQIAVEFTGQSGVITFGLDDSANLLDGTIATLCNSGDYYVTVSRGGSDTIGDEASTSFILLPGQKVELVLNISTGPNWVMKGSNNVVTNATLVNGYAVSALYGTARYRRSADGMVTIDGGVSKSGGSTSFMFNLPVGFRPVTARTFAVRLTDGSTWDMDDLIVNSNGNVNWQFNSFGPSTAVDINLQGISFYLD